jgi:hypothetical protein
VFGCDTVVRNDTVGMVRGAGVPSDGGVVVMGTIRVTTLHTREMGMPELPPMLEAMSSSSVDSSTIVSSDGDPLCTILTMMTPESLHSRERLRLLKLSAMNSKIPKQMVSPRVNPTQVWWSPLATMKGFG